MIKQQRIDLEYDTVDDFFDDIKTHDASNDIILGCGHLDF